LEILIFWRDLRIGDFISAPLLIFFEQLPALLNENGLMDVEIKCRLSKLSFSKEKAE
jgi:hypothetical protein